MSKYAFGIKTAATLLEKARHDADRYNQPKNDATAWTYAAIDYIQTAWHLADWIAGETGKTKKQVRADIDALCGGLFMLAGELAVGQKHWKMDPRYTPQVIAKSTAPPLQWRRTPIGFTTKRRESPCVIDNDGRKIYTQILIQDTLQAIEKYMRKLGLIQAPILLETSEANRPPEMACRERS